jgi:hypothetical protein
VEYVDIKITQEDVNRTKEALYQKAEERKKRYLSEWWSDFKNVGIVASSIIGITAVYVLVLLATKDWDDVERPIAWQIFKMIAIVVITAIAIKEIECIPVRKSIKRMEKQDVREYEAWLKNKQSHLTEMDWEVHSRFQKLWDIENILLNKENRILEIDAMDNLHCVPVVFSDSEGNVNREYISVGQTKENISIEKDQMFLQDGDVVYLRAVDPEKFDSAEEQN